MRQLQFFRGKPEELEKMGISINEILISIGIAVVHAIFEALLLWLEARASKTRYSNYISICLNGRFGWVPFTDFLLDSKSIAEEGESKKTKLDFTHIHTSCCYLKVFVDFEFSDLTLGGLAKTVGKMPIIKDEKKRNTLIFGNSINNV